MIYSQTTLPKLESALNEKDTENIWRETISSFFPDAIITSPFNTDGFLETSDGRISILFEFKFQENLKSKLSQVNILSQTLYYIKKFEVNGKKLPKVILIADKNECFVIHTNPLVKYLSYDLKWNVAASNAFKTNPDLIQDMLGDGDINPFVFDIQDGFNFIAIKNKILDLSDNVKRLIKVTEHNITNVFEYFCNNVLGKNALTVNETANLFVNLIINPGENYLHPKRKNILISKSFGDVYVNTDKYISFFSHFDGEQYSIREKEALTAIVDRIVEDETRRRKGEFFTPTIWVDEAHKMISETFGENWKEEYVVWDPASGTLNLTRDYKFKELYCSTIEESDLKTVDQMKYNPEAIKFQYDFLNDGIKDGRIDIGGDVKLPVGLKEALLEGKKMIVLMNPPYGTANNAGTDSGHKSGISLTEMNKMMKSDEWGASSQQLYAQFLYRLTKINRGNINICLFSPPLFMSGGSYKEFRKNFLESFGFTGGYLMNAGEFDGTSDWGLSFTMWDSPSHNKSDFKLNVKKSDDFGSIQYLFDKSIYNLDDRKEASKWVREEVKRLRTTDKPNLSSALSLKQIGRGKVTENSMGYFYNDNNNIAKNNQSVGLYSSANAAANGLSIISENYRKVTSLFCARRSISSKYANWINWCDEYMAPDESHPLWHQFQSDSIVYSLFESKSNQSSLRQITYKDKLWDIKNEFFWMSRDEMMSLSESKYFDDVYRDARSSDERYVYKLLYKEGIYEKLSPDAKEVLDMASALVVKSFDMRIALHNEKPELHLNTWDAGWYQIKLILKQFYQDDLREFTKKYKEFEDRMRPLVYELGFLRK
jgi:hypothetical protein